MSSSVLTDGVLNVLEPALYALQYEQCRSLVIQFDLGFLGVFVHGSGRLVEACISEESGNAFIETINTVYRKAKLVFRRAPWKTRKAASRSGSLDGYSGQQPSVAGAHQGHVARRS